MSGFEFGPATDPPHSRLANSGCSLKHLTAMWLPSEDRSLANSKHSEAVINPRCRAAAHKSSEIPASKLTKTMTTFSPQPDTTPSFAL